MILFILSFILSIIIFILSLITGADYVTWIQDKIKTAPTITFNNFKELYQIAPDKWRFKLNRINYNYEPIEFKSYFDLIKYRRFKKQVEKDDEKSQKIENETLFIKNLQKDIDDYKKKNILEMKKHLYNPCDKEWRVWLDVKRKDGTHYDINQSVFAPSKEDAKALIKAAYSNYTDTEISFLFIKEIEEINKNN